MDIEHANQLADKLFRAIERGDTAEAQACYHEKLQAWHNFDGQTQSLVQNLRTLKFLSKAVVDLRYTEVERSFFSNGFVQRHVLLGEVKGIGIKAPACIVAYVEDGLIHRLFEYMDTAHIQPLMQP